MARHAIPQVRLDAIGNGSRDGGQSYHFEDPVAEVRVTDVDQVRDGLSRVEAAVSEGLHAAGYVSYEAASGLDPCLETRPPRDGVPLLWFGLFRTRRRIQPLEGIDALPRTVSAWLPEWTAADHESRVHRVREWIAAGDTYQVNLTMRLRAAFDGDPEGLYHALCRAQPTSLCALIDTGDLVLCSASPELHFALEGGRLETRPMKGTRRRGRWLAEDEELAHELAASPKERAENTMIVDLLRNDLGRISGLGSVEVERLWDVERYRTVWQMTSTIRSHLQAHTSFADLFTAVFPCGSVTGAPKVRTMQIICDLEDSPRGVYTGSIGYLSPASGDPEAGASGSSNSHLTETASARSGVGSSPRGLRGMEARFSVAIRTVEIDRRRQQAMAGVGGGITWDSEAGAEYDECLAKARFLSRPDRGPFQLLETMRWEPGQGIWLAERHWRRLSESAAYFGFRCAQDDILAALDESVADMRDPARIRLCLAADGTSEIEVIPLTDVGQLTWTAAVSAVRVHSEDPFLYHKTTNRQVYEEAQSDLSGVAVEAILLNEHGQLTETVRGNLVAVIGSRRLTPPVSCGLLPGTYRAELLAHGEIEEAVLGEDDLLAATAVYCVNSVRRWVQLDLRLAAASHDIRAS